MADIDIRTQTDEAARAAMTGQNEAMLEAFPEFGPGEVSRLGWAVRNPAMRDNFPSITPDQWRELEGRMNSRDEDQAEYQDANALIGATPLSPGRMETIQEIEAKMGRGEELNSDEAAYVQGPDLPPPGDWRRTAANPGAQAGSAMDMPRPGITLGSAQAQFPGQDTVAAHRQAAARRQFEGANRLIGATPASSTADKPLGPQYISPEKAGGGDPNKPGPVSLREEDELPPELPTSMQVETPEPEPSKWSRFGFGRPKGQQQESPQTESSSAQTPRTGSYSRGRVK